MSSPESNPAPREIRQMTRSDGTLVDIPSAISTTATTVMCQTDAEVDEANVQALLATDLPLLRLTAVDTGPTHKTDTPQQRKDKRCKDGLYAITAITHGTPVLITQDIWYEVGLCNGTRGYIHSILFNEDQNPQAELPQVIMVGIPAYIGPTEWYDGDIPLVPIPPQTTTWEVDGQECTRKAFPFTPSYAVNINNYEACFGLRRETYSGQQRGVDKRRKELRELKEKELKEKELKEKELKEKESKEKQS